MMTGFVLGVDNALDVYVLAGVVVPARYVQSLPALMGSPLLSMAVNGTAGMSVPDWASASDGNRIARENAATHARLAAMTLRKFFIDIPAECFDWLCGFVSVIYFGIVFAALIAVAVQLIAALVFGPQPSPPPVVPLNPV
jgi:hypothetical protein